MYKTAIKCGEEKCTATVSDKEIRLNRWTCRKILDKSTDTYTHCILLNDSKDESNIIVRLINDELRQNIAKREGYKSKMFLSSVTFSEANQSFTVNIRKSFYDEIRDKFGVTEDFLVVLEKSNIKFLKNKIDIVFKYKGKRKKISYGKRGGKNVQPE